MRALHPSDIVLPTTRLQPEGLNMTAAGLGDGKCDQPDDRLLRMQAAWRLEVDPVILECIWSIHVAFKHSAVTMTTTAVPS